MKLYHRTSRKNLEGIFKYGLLRSFDGAGFIYLSPDKQGECFGEILLEVETRDHRLSSLEGSEAWEIFCWGRIRPWDIKRIMEEKNEMD